MEPLILILRGLPQYPILSNGIRQPKSKNLAIFPHFKILLMVLLLVPQPLYSYSEIVAISKVTTSQNTNQYSNDEPPNQVVLSFSGQGIKYTPDNSTFPDMTGNYQNTVVVPQQLVAQAAEEAAQQAAQAQAAQIAQAPQTAPQPATAPSGSCQDWMNEAGIVDQADAIQVINIESGCNPNAVNRSSGACGIGQQLPCGKWSHIWNDPVGSLIDMQIYVVADYGSWSGALAHERSYHWY